MNEYVNMQQEIKQMLESSVKNNRLSHAYIFYGDEGVGKSEMALYLTALLYSNGDVDMSSPTSKQIYTHQFPNLYEISIRPGKSEIVKDQIEDLMEEFSKTSLLDGPRVYVIHDADKVNMTSSNKLLKFVEEPEEGIYGIFITTHLSNILPTIVSRCNLVHFKSVDKTLLMDGLLAAGIDELDASIVKELTSNLSQALSIAESVEYQEGKDFALALIGSKKEAKMIEYLKNSYGANKNAKEVIQMLNVLSIILEDMLGDKNFKISGLENVYSSFKRYNDLDSIERKLQMVLDYIKMCDAHVGLRNVLTALIANWYR